MKIEMAKAKELSEENQFLKEFMVNPAHVNVQSVYNYFNVVGDEKRLYRCLINNFLYYYSRPNDTVYVVNYGIDKLYHKLFNYYGVIYKKSLNANVVFVNNLKGDKRVKPFCGILGVLSSTKDNFKEINYYENQGYKLRRQIGIARKYLVKGRDWVWSNQIVQGSGFPDDKVISCNFSILRHPDYYKESVKKTIDDWL